jgi:hypothetical protein
MTPEESQGLEQWFYRELVTSGYGPGTATEYFVRVLKENFFREVQENGLTPLQAWNVALLSARVAENKRQNPNVGFVNPFAELDLPNKQWLNRQLEYLQPSPEDKAVIEEGYTLNINEGVTDKVLAWDFALQNLQRKRPLSPELIQWIQNRPEFQEYMKDRPLPPLSTWSPEEWSGRFLSNFSWSYNKNHNAENAMAATLRQAQKRIANLRAKPLFQQTLEQEQEVKTEILEHLANLRAKGGREIFLPARPNVEVAELQRIRNESCAYLAEIGTSRHHRRRQRGRRVGQRPGIALARSLSDVAMELALRLYTRGGDAQLNTYLRNPLSGRVRRTKAVRLPRWVYEEPELIQAMRIREGNSNWVPTIDWVIRELRRVMYHAPRTKRPVVLYRGIKSGEGTINNPQTYFTDEGVMSATGWVGVAQGFTNQGEHCCVLQLFIPAGTPILSLQSISEFPQEDEFILAPGRTFFVEQPPLSTANDEVYFGPPPREVRSGEAYGWSPYEGMVYNLVLRPRVLPEEETKEEELPYFETVAFDPTYEPSAMELEEALEEEELAEQELEPYDWRREFEERVGLRELHTSGVVPRPLFGYAHQRRRKWCCDESCVHW